jgi:CheY-like chemotaxis protein
MDEAAIRILVRDTGFGIAAADLPNLFEPYNRLGAERGTIEGTGLGLAICNRLAKMMQTEIGCESGVDGSAFWIDLAIAPPMAASPSIDIPAKGVTSMDQIQILYVDDDESCINLLKEIINVRTSATITVARTSGEARRLIATNRFDVIILDINLPDTTGFDLLYRIRHDVSQVVPVVALSAAARKQDIAAGLAAGFTSYVTKPFNTDNLIEVICNALADAVEAREDAVLDPPENSKGRDTVLVIEDELEIRLMIVDQLEELGYNVLHANSGTSGLASFRRNTPDMVLVDFSMPGMNGVEVTNKARELVPNLPAIIISAYADAGSLFEIIGPRTSVLRKPFSAKDLRKAVDRMLPTREASQGRA